jgi:hypothetical protein
MNGANFDQPQIVDIHPRSRMCHTHAFCINYRANNIQRPPLAIITLQQLKKSGVNAMSKTAIINAAEWWGNTGIVLEAGKSYLLRASGDWFDADIKASPIGWDLNSIEEWKRPFFREVESLRPLNTGDRWFSLIAKIGKDGNIFEIGNEHQTLELADDGSLYCTANDLPIAYWNNSGFLTLTVDELTD